MIVLGIESSCDETSVGIVEDGRNLMANVVASQVDIHARYGGIVPEVASRQHVLQIVPTIENALLKSKLSLEDIDSIAVTYAPGLLGALMVGVNAAKALAFTKNKNFLGVHHLEGHVYASWLEKIDPSSEPGFPLLCLIASGAHTDLIVMSDHGKYNVIGRTRDDAAGEAFDKAARLLGLGFPGGPAIQKVAHNIKPEISLPRAWMGDTFDFSFSGLKTAVLHKAQEKGLYPPPPHGISADEVAKMAAAFQEAVVDVMIKKAIRAVKDYKVKGLLLGGGVAANSLLREEAIKQSPVPVLIPSPVLCTDNGAMIAAAAYFRLRQGETHQFDLDPKSSLSMAS